MKIYRFGGIFPEVSNEGRGVTCDGVVLFQTLADVIEDVRNNRKEPEEGIHCQTREKFELLARGGNLTITLTKKGSVYGYGHQLRVWVKNPEFRNDGTHADEYGRGGIFEAYGNFDGLDTLTEQFLTKKLRRFEDECYVVWV